MKFLLFALLFTSCAKQSPREKLSNYKCSREQLDLVNKERIQCSLGDFPSTCFRIAKMSQCDYIGPKDNIK
jgi:hypothetical protein